MRYSGRTVRLGSICLCIAVLAGPAHARSTRADSAPVAIVPFTGLHGDEPQAAILHQLGARAAVVTEGQLASVKPYVIVRGVVDKKDGLKLSITITDDKGQSAGTLVVPVLGGRHLTPDQLKKLSADVEDLVNQTLSATPPPPPEPVAVAPPPEAPAKQAGDVEKAPLTGLSEEKKHPAQAVVHRAWLPEVARPSYYPYVVAHAGAVITSRALDFGPTQPPVFHGGTAGGVAAEIELYPFAWSHALKHGVFAGLGGYIGVVKPFWPTTTLDGTTNEYDTDELRVEGGARWRFVLRKVAPVVELTAYGGAGLHTFTIAKQMLPTGNLVDAGPPDARYVYGVIGAEARVHLWNERILPFVRIGYEYVPDAGPTENLDEYGLSNTHGFQLRGGVDARVWRRLTVGASVFWEYLALNFQDNVPTARTATDAHDQYYGALFTVGWAL
jgi:hypothetical protein